MAPADLPIDQDASIRAYLPWTPDGAPRDGLGTVVAPSQPRPVSRRHGPVRGCGDDSHALFRRWVMFQKCTVTVAALTLGVLGVGYMAAQPKAAKAAYRE